MKLPRWFERLKVPLWLEKPRIISAESSRLRVDGGMARIRVEGQGYGILVCGDARVSVRGQTKVTFTVPVDSGAVTVAFRSLFGTAETTVLVPAGHQLDGVPRVDIAEPGLRMNPAALRAAMKPTLRRPSVVPGALSARPQFKLLRRDFNRARLRHVPLGVGVSAGAARPQLLVIVQPFNRKRLRFFPKPEEFA